MNENKGLTLDEFFCNQAESKHLFEALLCQINEFGPVELKVTKSQIAFRRNKTFAWAWMPGKYLRGKVAPLVLTLPFRKRDSSPRWKEIVEPSRGQFIHHLELFSISDIDDEVKEWLRATWQTAG
jgi:hypothetical protein